MSASKYTPGPWLLSNDTIYALNEQGTNRMRVCVEGGHVHDARDAAHRERSSEEEKLANARLIAAAPELLEALLAIKRFGELANVSAGRDWGGSSGKKPASKDVFQFPRHLLVELDAALAKAGAS